MIIGTHNTDEWGVVSTFSITPPEVVTRYIEIPGRNGMIDASEALTGYPTYSDRELSVQLLIVDKTADEFQKIYDDIYASLHGQRLDASVPHDEGYHYTGRWAVSSINHETRNVRTIDLICQCEPYAKKDSVTSKTISTGSLEVSSVMPTKLTIKATAQTSITRGGTTTTYSVGTHEIAYPLLVGSETLTINSGSGTIEWREGKL